jgi:predicted nuclease of predicted toxin-antitoxin system
VLLFDANLSPRLVGSLVSLFPGSQHVFSQGALLTTDAAIWAYAKAKNLTIVSKDSDFYYMSMVFGRPTKGRMAPHR